MYKQHQISRMFMCRCCNWAFPDKTSLHMHMQVLFLICSFSKLFAELKRKKKNQNVYISIIKALVNI